MLPIGSGKLSGTSERLLQVAGSFREHPNGKRRCWCFHQQPVAAAMPKKFLLNVFRLNAYLCPNAAVGVFTNSLQGKKKICLRKNLRRRTLSCVALLLNLDFLASVINEKEQQLVSYFVFKFYCSSNREDTGRSPVPVRFIRFG